MCCSFRENFNWTDAAAKDVFEKSIHTPLRRIEGWAVWERRKKSRTSRS
jgi:hypothetical protein